MAIASAVSNVLQMKKKRKKKSYVSHVVIAVFALMQNEVNETICAVFDCNMWLLPKIFLTDVYPLFSHIRVTLLEMS